jgi:predicted DsbA family dithiol-disulfide isomerase
MCLLERAPADRHLSRMTRALKIDLFTDTVCPWCLIGSVRLDKAVAKLPADVVVDIENHPFYLDPNTPAEGHDVGEMLRAKYGRDPKEIWARAEEQARLSGIDLDLSQQPRTFPTQKGHTLVRLARVKGTQHALANDIAWTYFMDHRQINDDEVLVGIATRHGYADDEARQAINDPDELGTTHDLAVDAARQGIQGVPFFVFDGRFSISGAYPEESFERALRIAIGDEAMPA